MGFPVSSVLNCLETRKQWLITLFPHFLLPYCFFMLQQQFTKQKQTFLWIHSIREKRFNQEINFHLKFVISLEVVRPGF